MSDQAKLVENQLFDWTGGWDQYDTAIFGFYDATLKIPFGDFQVGEAFDSVTVGYENSTITLHRGDDEWKFELYLSVGQAIQ